MTPKEKFLSMAEGSKAAIEDFNDFSDDRAIAWAADALTAEREVSDKLEKALLESAKHLWNAFDNDNNAAKADAALAEVAAIRATNTNRDQAD